MRYLLTIMIISALLSCKKDKDEKPVMPAPAVSNVEISSELVNGTARPKFTITLTVPDTSKVASLYLYQNANFPAAYAGLVKSPKAGQYIIIDNGASYPPTSPIKYFAFFAMKDFNNVGYYPFEVK